MPFLKLYPSFARPEFYQPPQWRYRREAARGHNPNQKNCELTEAAKTLNRPPAPATEEQKGSGSSTRAPTRAQPAATKKRLIPAGQASGQRHYQRKESSGEDDHKPSDWEEDDSEDDEFLDLDDVVFVKDDDEDESDASSDDEYEIDDSFLDPEDKADREGSQRNYVYPLHAAHSTGRGKSS